MAQGQAVDNTDPGFTAAGPWESSTVVSGYQGSDYQYHSANGPLVGGIVLDNQDGTGASTWKSSASIAGYEGQDYQAHPAGDGSEPYQWTTAVAGSYVVYAKWTSHPNRATRATYTITHANGTTEVTVNQQENGGQWNPLGTYTFDQQVQIQLSDQADGTVIADAIALVPTDAQPNTAIWTHATTPGDYQVYARWTEHPNRAPDAAYSVTHAGGSQTITVNQQTNGGQWNLLGTYPLDGQSTIQLSDRANGYVIADALRLVPTQPSQTGTVWTLNYIHADHLGTPRVVTDGQGQAIWSWPLNEPFGDNGVNEDVDGDGKTFTLNLRFPGQYYDQETGLSYNYFRDYDPTIGRYIESDPIGLRGGLNTYAYVGGNPVINSDSKGLDLDGSSSFSSSFPYFIPWGFPTPDEHKNRNQNNHCPSKPPEEDCWKYDEIREKWRHSAGYECKYLPDGTPAPDDGLNQTFNYGGGNNPGFNPFNGNNWSHGWKDVLPVIPYGERVNPNQTIYEYPRDSSSL